MLLCPQDTRGQPQAWFRESGYVHTLNKRLSFLFFPYDGFNRLSYRHGCTKFETLESLFSPSTMTQTIILWRVFRGRILRSQFMSMFSWCHHILLLWGGNSNVSKLLKLCKYYPWKFFFKKKNEEMCYFLKLINVHIRILSTLSK